MPLPHFIIKYPVADINTAQSKTYITRAGLQLMCEHYSLEPFFTENERYCVCIVGNPVLGEVINLQAVGKLILSGKRDANTFRSFNGEFLIFCIDKQEKKLSIINDRFTSIPLFYVADEQRFIGSIFYNDIFLLLRHEGLLTLRKESFFEYLWLNRILGTKTYDTLSRFLPAATMLVYNKAKVELDTYWVPSFQKTTASVQQCAVQLGDLFRQSIKRKTSDGVKRCGVFFKWRF